MEVIVVDSPPALQAQDHQQLAMFASLKHYEVCFRSLVDGKCLRFPCDPSGEVDLNRLDERERLGYLYARALMGMRFAFPVVVAAGA